MKKRYGILLAAALAAALVGLALPRLLNGQRAAGKSLSLWYSERDCPREGMEALLAAYEEETGARIEAVSFPDEQSMAEAFGERQPELLLCSHVRAAGIDERLGLARLPELPPLRAETENALAGLEGAFYPIGARVPLLLLDAARVGRDYASYEELMRAAAAAGGPFLAAESWSELLFQAMQARGRQMWGRLAQDSADAVYTALYNRLAEAAYGGGLALVSDAAEYVRQGLVPCAVVPSTALAGREDPALRVTMLPVPEGGRAGCSGELLGFAIVKTEKSAGAERAFLNWLAAGARPAETALAMGLVPLTVTEPDPEASALETLLAEMAAKGLLRCPPASLPCFANREAGEAELRERLDLLA